MTQTKALKLALEALACCRDMVGHPDNLEYIDQKIHVIKEALAQPEQEPVACVFVAYDGKKDLDFFQSEIDLLPVGTNLYTSPPPVPEAHKRTWVGLTDKEIRKAAGIDGGTDTWIFETAYAIEAKLKEKNT